MPLSAQGRVLKVETHRTLLYVSRKLAEDSAWPFEPGESVLMTIDPARRRLIVEKRVRVEGGTDS